MQPIQICTKCLYTSKHPLGLTFDENGVCSGCQIHEEKDILNWTERFSALKSIVDGYRVQSGKAYDCIVPVTGANDSYFIVHIVKNVLKLNPLLVAYNKYYNTPLGIWNLANLRIQFDCDILFQNVNPVSVKKITRATFRRFGSLYWHCLAGQTVFPVQTAVRFRIPLIIWGAHQGLEQVGMFSHEHEVEMSRRYRKDHDLFGVEADDLLSIFDVLDEGDIWQYRYPDDSSLADVGVRGIYLGNYLRWDPKAQHEEMIRRYKYRTAAFSRTFDCYDHVDCYEFMGLHDYLKLAKHGYSKVTDHACREIRHKRISREAAISLVRHYEQGALTNSALFREWIDATPEGLAFVIDRHRNSDWWLQEAPSKWKFKGASTLLPTSIPFGSHQESGCTFEASHHLNNGKASAYITVGKGFP